MTKVLFIVDGYPDNKRATNIFIKNQATALRSKGIEIGVMVVDIRSVRRIRKFGFYKSIIDDIPVWHVSFPWGGFFPGIAQRLYNYLGKKAYLKIQKVFGRPDILHSHFGGAGIIGAKIKKKYGVPLVITEHGSKMLPHSKNNRHKKRVLNEAYRVCDKLIAVSSTLANNIKGFGIEPVLVIPNIIPENYFVYDNKTGVNKKKQFISVGNLLPNKRFDLVILAFKKLCNLKDDVTLSIVGDGPLKKDLSKMILKEKIENKVFLRGFVKNSELPELYRKSICFVLPSEYETFGVVYAEALASGIPVIATDCGGPADIVNKSNGLIIKTNSEVALFEAMYYMYDNHLNYDSETLIKDCYNRFGEESVINSIIGVYADIHS
jgi:glycosyltransferase involved in cell wall biosynthesis